MERLILVTNDDDITSAGIQALVEIAQEFGKVVVVAPNAPQSGMGHAISIGTPLRLYSYRFPTMPEIEAWACSGTPVDCVKLATGVLLPQKPHLILSGINHGANYSISVFYSGTMSAAIEGVIENIPSIGFSFCNYDPNADLTTAKIAVRTILKVALESGFPPHTALNVNIPNVPPSELKGYRITRQAIGRFIEEFDKRIDPYNQPYYWLVGSFSTQDRGEDTDVWAIQNGYVSVTPITIDLTAYSAMQDLHLWEFPQQQTLHE